MHEAVKKFRAESEKKVFVSMSSVAASGGYYVACAADRIFANSATITGSIGVITEWVNYGDLLEWAKLRSVVIKTGSFKDAGSSTRPLTDEEREYFQALIDSMHNQFITAVATGRNMEEAEVRTLADGRVFTGQDALENGLVDELGTYEDTIEAAALSAGIEGTPNIIRPTKVNISLFDLLLGDAKSVLSRNADRSESHIRFEYLWR
jgi:protease-4